MADGCEFHLLSVSCLDIPSKSCWQAILKEVTHPDDFEEDWNQCQRLIRGEIKSFDLEKRYIRKDGQIIWGYLNRSIVTDAKGRPVYFLTYIKDVTGRKLAEEALRRGEEALRESHARIEDLAGRLIIAQEEERKHLARELHDDVNQQIAALAIGLGKLDRQLVGADEGVRNQISKLEDRVARLSERIRELSHELHSSTLEHVGLAEALRLSARSLLLRKASQSISRFRMASGHCQTMQPCVCTGWRRNHCKTLPGIQAQRGPK